MNGHAKTGYKDFDVYGDGGQDLHVHDISSSAFPDGFILPASCSLPLPPDHFYLHLLQSTGRGHNIRHSWTRSPLTFLYLGEMSRGGYIFHIEGLVAPLQYRIYIRRVLVSPPANDILHVWLSSLLCHLTPPPLPSFQVAGLVVLFHAGRNPLTCLKNPRTSKSNAQYRALGDCGVTIVVTALKGLACKGEKWFVQMGSIDQIKSYWSLGLSTGSCFIRLGPTSSSAREISDSGYREIGQGPVNLRKKGEHIRTLLITPAYFAPTTKFALSFPRNPSLSHSDCVTSTRRRPPFLDCDDFGASRVCKRCDWAVTDGHDSIALYGNLESSPVTPRHSTQAQPGLYDILGFDPRIYWRLRQQYFKPDLKSDVEYRISSLYPANIKDDSIPNISNFVINIRASILRGGREDWE
ncbi:hypothetical protein NEOLEDRAFT_1171717 [Neolentinus lepideus HHB14362 ss-1]|uniref:Uncharacterized protein n=1 Tax=Neolentinus lepideus HHB14362 ss-1 TaxID=1314782 RepID=A0A165Q2N1_9AGAM|nr:hypothetical protein NEOLEDRAFT_1171717 [Neolentinus lepideus HHB14362 ss-1]